MFLPLHTTRVTLRSFAPADTAVFAAYRNDPEVARYQDWDLPVTEAGALEFLTAQQTVARPVPGDWVQIAVEYDGELAGDVAVGLDPAGKQATIGYTLRADRQRLGIGREAVSALVDVLLDQLDVHRVTATLDPRNTGSARLLEQLGFRYEGCAKRQGRGRGPRRLGGRRPLRPAARGPRGLAHPAHRPPRRGRAGRDRPVQRGRRRPARHAPHPGALRGPHGSSRPAGWTHPTAPSPSIAASASAPPASSMTTRSWPPCASSLGLARRRRASKCTQSPAGAPRGRLGSGSARVARADTRCSLTSCSPVCSTIPQRRRGPPQLTPTGACHLPASQLLRGEPLCSGAARRWCTPVRPAGWRAGPAGAGSRRNDALVQHHLLTP